MKQQMVSTKRLSVITLVALAFLMMPVSLPAQQSQPVTGNTGTVGTEINNSSRASVDQNTPGAQTTAGEQQEHGWKATAAPNKEPVSPPEWGKVGDSQQAGDANAAAAERTQEQKGSTLGVNAMPEYADPKRPQSEPDSHQANPSTQKKQKSKLARRDKDVGKSHPSSSSPPP